MANLWPSKEYLRPPCQIFYTKLGYSDTIPYTLYVTIKNIFEKILLRKQKSIHTSDLDKGKHSIENVTTL